MAIDSGVEPLNSDTTDLTRGCDFDSFAYWGPNSDDHCQVSQHEIDTLDPLPVEPAFESPFADSPALALEPWLPASPAPAPASDQPLFLTSSETNHPPSLEPPVNRVAGTASYPLDASPHAPAAAREPGPSARSSDVRSSDVLAPGQPDSVVAPTTANAFPQASALLHHGVSSGEEAVSMSDSQLRTKRDHQSLKNDHLASVANPSSVRSRDIAANVERGQNKKQKIDCYPGLLDMTPELRAQVCFLFKSQPDPELSFYNDLAMKFSKITSVSASTVFHWFREMRICQRLRNCPMDCYPSLLDMTPELREQVCFLFKLQPDPELSSYNDLAMQLSKITSVSASMVFHWFREMRICQRLRDGCSIDTPDIFREMAPAQLHDSGYVTGLGESGHNSMDMSRATESREMLSQLVVSQPNPSPSLASLRDVPPQSMLGMQSVPSGAQTRGETPQRSGMLCPMEGCDKQLPTRSDWQSHCASHWPTKCGCWFCYVDENNECSLCGGEVMDRDLAFEHVRDCVERHPAELKAIATEKKGFLSKAGWWKFPKTQGDEKRTYKSFKDHLQTRHQAELPQEGLKNIRECKVTVPRPDTVTCRECNKICPSWIIFDEHTYEHLKSRTKVGDPTPGIRAQPRGSGDGDEDGGDGGGGGGGGGSSSGNPSTQPSPGRQPDRPRAAGSQSTPTITSGTASFQSNLDLCGTGSQFLGQPLRNSGRGVEPAAPIVIEDGPHVPQEPYKIRHLAPLGKGATSVVDLVSDSRRSGKILARKTWRTGPKASVQDLVSQVRREITALTMLRHRHIVSLVDWSETGGSVQLLMSPVADEDLGAFLGSAGQPVPADQDNLFKPSRRQPTMIDQVATWMACLSSALAYIHSVGMTHGDLKPQNVLLRGKQALLGDFGSAEYDWGCLQNLDLPSRWATPIYSPPEVRTRTPRGRAADVWSLGCILVEVATWAGGYRTQALRDFRGWAGAKAYHTDIKSTLQWTSKLRRQFEHDAHLLRKVYLLDAATNMLVLDPGGRISSIEARRRLTPSGDCEGECLCSQT